MNLVRRLLGVEPLWGKKDEIALAMTLFNSECSLPPFLPVIVRKSALEESKKRDKGYHLEVINLFPTFKGTNARNRTAVYGENVIEMNPKRVLDDRPLIAVDKFDYRKLENVIGFVRASGAATYTIDGLSSIKDLITNIGNFKKYFNYSAWLGHRTGNSGPDTSSENMIALMSIYDLKCIIPIYNRKKADGIGVHISFMWEKMTARSDRVRFSDEIFFALNNHTDNLLAVDGQPVYKSGFVGNDYINHLRDVVAREDRRQNEVQKRTKMSKKKGSKSDSGQKKPTLQELKELSEMQSRPRRISKSAAWSAPSNNQYSYSTTTITTTS